MELETRAFRSLFFLIIFKDIAFVQVEVVEVVSLLFINVDQAEEVTRIRYEVFTDHDVYVRWRYKQSMCVILIMRIENDQVILKS